MEAMRNDQVEAAEYLRSPRLLVRRWNSRPAYCSFRSPDWTSRVLPMRAVCRDGRMERKAADGQYGRAGTAVKVRWICSQP